MRASENDEPGENPPSMSVVLSSVSAKDAQKTIEHLRAQTACDELELVIVTQAEGAGREFELSPEVVAPFASHIVVSLPSIRSKAAANAAGARRASAPVVAFAEDHCFAEPGWAEALIRRHREAYAAVGPLVRNANPATAISWCDLLVNYSPWLQASKGSERGGLPGHNCSYKKAALLHYDDRLVEWLEVENEMHLDMARRHLGLCFEPEAVVEHVNLSLWSSWLLCLFHGGRIYAAERCREWGAGRRLTYAVAWPLIGALRWSRLLVAWPADVPDLPSRAKLGPTLLVGFLSDAAGQAMGYLRGAGHAAARMLRFEFARAAHLHRSERNLLEAPGGSLDRRQRR